MQSEDGKLGSAKSGQGANALAHSNSGSQPRVESSSQAGSSQTGGAVDLGLGDLLKKIEEVNASAAPTPSLPTSSLLQQSDSSFNGSNVDGSLEPPAVDSTNSQSSESLPVVTPLAPSSTYRELALGGKWSELSQLCEREIASSTSYDVEAQLWWIESQRKSSHMPVTILAAPLESATRNLLEASLYSKLASNLEKRNELVVLATKLLRELSGSLKSAGEVALSITFLERAFRLDGEEVVLLLTESRAELKRLEALPNIRKSAEIRSEIDRLNVLIAEVAVSKPKFSATMPSQPTSRNNNSLDGREGNNRKGDAKVATPSKEGRSWPFHYAGFAALILAALLVLNVFSPSVELSLSGQTELANYSGPQLVVPSVDRTEGLGMLDAVYYEMQRETPASVVQPTLPEPQLPVVARESGRVNDLPAPMVETGQTSTRPPPVVREQREKEQIDMRGPVEDRRRPPRDVDTRQNEPAEIDFPPFRSNRNQRSREESENSDRARLVTVISRTRVMEEPSYWARAFEDLYPGDQIEVEERLGKWIKIRSRRGKSGYILAQDADR